MSKAKDRDTVRVHYTGKLADGTVFDASDGREPLEFTLGEGVLITGFEHAVLGMNPGEEKSVTIPAAQAYGERRPELVVSVDRSQYPGDTDPVLGQQVKINQQDGSDLIAVVTAFDETTVTLDGNHHLGGQDLTFNIELVEIKE